MVAIRQSDNFLNSQREKIHRIGMDTYTWWAMALRYRR